MDIAEPLRELGTVDIVPLKDSILGLAKVSVAYHLNNDTMIYGLWTEGYRPGGTNRSRGDPFFPNTYFADKMTNWEAGLKSIFADGAVRLNVTAF